MSREPEGDGQDFRGVGGDGVPPIGGDPPKAVCRLYRNKFCVYRHWLNGTERSPVLSRGLGLRAALAAAGPS